MRSPNSSESCNLYTCNRKTIRVRGCAANGGLPGLLKVGASQPLGVSRRPDWPRRCSPGGFEVDAS